MEIKIFENAEFGSVRTANCNGKIYFCGKDVAIAFGYKNPLKAIRDHCKGVNELDTPTSGGIQKMKFISEGDIYRLAVKSELPNADKFESWIFDEVVPTVYKHGAYMTPQVIEQTLTNPDFIIQLATTLKEEQAKVKQLETKVETDKPKVIFADAVSVSNTDISVADLAKLIKQNNKDIKIGQNKLFEWLRDNGYLISRKGTDFNSPTQRAMELKLFRVKETAITHSDGHVTINKTSKVTGKGQQYFINKIMKEYNAKNEVNENTNTYVE